MDLTNSVSVTGTLATANGKTASTTLKDIKVTKVYVEVGDEVQEGDIICTYDSSDIEDALADAKNNYAVNRQLDALDMRPSIRIPFPMQRTACRTPRIPGTPIKMPMPTPRRQSRMHWIS